MTILNMHGLNKMRHLLFGIFILMLSACQQPNDSSINIQTNQSVGEQATDDTSAFVGCYTIDKHKPAQIKITHDGNAYFMQMKEPKGASTIWDQPETIYSLDIDSAWEFYKVNALSLDKSDIEMVIARPDHMMVLAKVKSSTININPLLDSPYVVYIFRGSNTIYQVECDDEQLNIISY